MPIVRGAHTVERIDTSHTRTERSARRNKGTTCRVGRGFTIYSKSTDWGHSSQLKQQEWGGRAASTDPGDRLRYHLGHQPGYDAYHQHLLLRTQDTMHIIKNTHHTRVVSIFLYIMCMWFVIGKLTFIKCTHKMWTILACVFRKYYIIGNLEKLDVLRAYRCRSGSKYCYQHKPNNLVSVTVQTYLHNYTWVPIHVQWYQGSWKGT